MSNAILRVHCADRKGIIAGLSDFVFRHGGNILDLDQHTDPDGGRFFMRLVWSMERFASTPKECAWRWMFTLAVSG